MLHRKRKNGEDEGKNAFETWFSMSLWKRMFLRSIFEKSRVQLSQSGAQAEPVKVLRTITLHSKMTELYSEAAEMKTSPVQTASKSSQEKYHLSHQAPQRITPPSLQQNPTAITKTPAIQLLAGLTPQQDHKRPEAAASVSHQP